MDGHHVNGLSLWSPEAAAHLAEARLARPVMEAKRNASAELAELIPLARRAGSGVTEIVAGDYEPAVGLARSGDRKPL